MKLSSELQLKWVNTVEEGHEEDEEELDKSVAKKNKFPHCETGASLLV